MPESVSTPRDRVFLAGQRLRTAEELNRNDPGSIPPARLADAEGSDETA